MGHPVEDHVAHRHLAQKDLSPALGGDDAGEPVEGFPVIVGHRRGGIFQTQAGGSGCGIPGQEPSGGVSHHGQRQITASLPASHPRGDVEGPAVDLHPNGPGNGGELQPLSSEDGPLPVPAQVIAFPLGQGLQGDIAHSVRYPALFPGQGDSVHLHHRGGGGNGEGTGGQQGGKGPLPSSVSHKIRSFPMIFPF